MSTAVRDGFWARSHTSIVPKCLISPPRFSQPRAPSHSYSVHHRPTKPKRRLIRRLNLHDPVIKYDSKPFWYDRRKKQLQNARNLRDLCSTLSTEELEKKLEDEATTRPDILTVRTILQTLYRSKQKTPTAWHYRCLILAQADAKYGSCGTLEEILQSMEREGFEIGPLHLHAALSVLAIHPNYVLRSYLMSTARAKSIVLSPVGWHDLATALIRERQLELAMETVEQMEAEHIKVQPWLRRLCVYSLCDAGEFQSATEAANKVSDLEGEIAVNVWAYVLDMASTAYHHETVSYVWNRIVEMESFSPARGICLNVLITAARAGDSRLATSVFKILSHRSDTLNLTEYETLIEAYIEASEPESALRIMCTFPSLTIEPDTGTTRSLVLHLRSNADYPPSAAWDFLCSITLNAPSMKMVSAPTAVLNAIMEAYLDLAQPYAAQEVYRDRSKVCLSAPNLRTFHLLLRACQAVNDVSQVEEIHSTMPDFNIEADALSYELSILTAVTAKDFLTAYTYLVELKEIGENLKEDAWRSVAGLLEGENDDWASALRDELKIGSEDLVEGEEDTREEDTEQVAYQHGAL